MSFCTPRAGPYHLFILFLFFWIWNTVYNLNLFPDLNTIIYHQAPPHEAFYFSQSFFEMAILTQLSLSAYLKSATHAHLRSSWCLLCKSPSVLCPPSLQCSSLSVSCSWSCSRLSPRSGWPRNSPDLNRLKTSGIGSRTNSRRSRLPASQSWWRR